ncbi:hypothetical protein [Amycolatopsis sp. H20-H5]|uniref:hypothetical protein n=1 Tax=Amycolatopsis sp. H20-H5 TaxID=3046309 RepID=UPI002DBF9330|nr:hypothetical protein [Amycolatopsis sp. H20-H5]MEC3977878.1 hypothetical protein [Amycolatopsis sp. H20-H5]
MTTPPSEDESPVQRPVGRFEWERIVRRVPMPQRVKLLALTLSSYADADGTRVRPGFDILAAVTGQSDRTVRRSMSALRDDFGLVDQVSRGGGRAGRGKAAEYRLTVPTDLLDRVALLPVGDAARSVQKAKRPANQVTDQSPDSPVTNVADQPEPSPVDKPDSPANQVTDETPEPELNDRSREVGFDRMTGQTDRLTGHSGGRLPATTPPTTDHNISPDPTQPPTAHGPAVERKPAKCPHGLPAHLRPDGSPTCPMCRRNPTTQETP